MAHLRLHLPQLLSSFRPDLVLYNAGVDPHTDDPLGRLSLTDQGHLPTNIENLQLNSFLLVCTVIVWVVRLPSLSASVLI